MPSADRDPRGPTRILVDTNGWFLPVRSGTDLYGEIDRLLPGAEIRVPTPVLRELERLRGRGTAGAEVALELARRAPELRCPGRGDAAVLEAAARSGDWVLTGDQRLADRLRARGISVLVPRDRTRLVAHRGAPAAASSTQANARRRTRTRA